MESACRLDVYYWVALDFRTGQTVWKKLAGTGQPVSTPSTPPEGTSDPTSALYTGVYGGIMMLRDTR